MTKHRTPVPVARVATDQTPGPGPWVQQAACAGLPTGHFFSDDPADTDRARAVCRSCSVRDDCAAYALAIPGLDGVWGGLTEADRHRIRRRQARHAGGLPETGPTTQACLGPPAPSWQHLGAELDAAGTDRERGSQRESVAYRSETR